MSDQIPRIPYDDLPPNLKEQLAPRFKRLGYLGEWFQATAVAPDVQYHFTEMTTALKEALPDDLTELVALAVATKMDNAYELNQHERLCLKTGLDQDWVKAVEALDPASGALTKAQQLTLAYTVATVDRNGHGTGQEFSAMTAEIGPPQAVAVMMLIGRYIAHAMVVNTLSLEPPVTSIFDQGG